MVSILDRIEQEGNYMVVCSCVSDKTQHHLSLKIRMD